MARSASGRDESFCLDVVQDCMMRVVKSLPSLPTEAAVAAWLARALFTTAVDRLRQEQRRRRREREVAQRGDGAVDSGAGLEEDERLAWLRARLAELPATDRALMRERFEVGRTLDQIGAAHGMTGHAAHGRLWRIVARLKRAAQREITDD
jgi:RNA polymerase sigma factor (sigma-70 family)